LIKRVFAKNQQVRFFFISSSDVIPTADLYQPKKCVFIKRLKSRSGKDLMLVSIDPSVIVGPARSLPQDLAGKQTPFDKVILATRHKGYSLFPMDTLPLSVHVSVTQVDNIEKRDWIEDNELILWAWAEVYETSDDAKTRKPLAFVKNR
jgi:hypothetical protein